jgi:hypothetical protein
MPRKYCCYIEASLWDAVTISSLAFLAIKAANIVFVSLYSCTELELSKIQQHE